MNEPHDPDVRDEALGALLAVPPLDDVTRRRLVRTALDQPAPRSNRWMSVASVAAALAIGTFVGTVLVRDSEPSETTTAQRAPTPSDVERLKSVPAAGADASEAPITVLGDLGDVTRPADLRDAIDLGFERAVGPTENQAVMGYPCVGSPPANFGLVAASAVGIGTYEGAAVTVFIGTSPDGQAIAVVARASDCAVAATVKL